ncbi:hypothetical protein EVAR_16939_1 [Eumeta japonica]|uniref:Uncharacterized protein n=1 Tax=Eumeta variegata TaxID=151549 RepID=A0A4C1TVT0_EUMVA|nr:hypothetical protein EVAR_16939_1 [Eumeta japonica]
MLVHQDKINIEYIGGIHNLAYFHQSEIVHKEEVDLFIFEIREEILDESMKICYEKYMKEQAVSFTIDCAVRAWLKLMDWHFYRHDPGDEKYASPACFIPNSEVSWIPDELPRPSPKDSWAKMDVGEESEASGKSVFRKSTSASSLDYPTVEKISSEHHFPGKVQIEVDNANELLERTITYTSSSVLESSVVGSSSEVLERVTDYPDEEQSASRVHTYILNLQRHEQCGVR